MSTFILPFMISTIGKSHLTFCGCAGFESPTWQGPQAINWGDTQDHPISQTFLKPFLIQQDPSRFVEPVMHDSSCCA